MSQTIDKSQVLEWMRNAHVEMQEYLESLTHEQRVAPVLDEGWSVKDSLAHIAAWENMSIDWLERSLRGEQVKRFTPEFVQPDDPAESDRVINALNQHLFEQSRNRSWDDVLAEFNAAHENLYRVVERMSDDDIFNPQRFAWRKGSPALDLIAGNTYEHYEEHRGWMRAGIARNQV